MVSEEVLRVNFVKYSAFVSTRTSKTHIFFCSFLSIALSIYLVSCTDQIEPPSAAQLIEFENAGPAGPTVDLDRLVRAKIGGGPYRVAPGEVLEFTMPTILQVVTADEPAISGQMAPYVCRISENGFITLPVVGEVKVARKTLAEIECVVTKAYHPKYTVIRPSVFVRVLEYKTIRVSITGAVAKPGIYSLRSDQMSVVALLMEAGGIVDEGATCIRILHSNQITSDNQTKSINSINVSGSRLNGFTASNMKQRQARLEKLAAMVPYASTFEAIEVNRTPIKLYEPDYNTRITDYKFTNQNLAADIKLTAKASEQDSNINTALDKKLCKAYTLKQNLEASGHDEPENAYTGGSLVLPVKGLNIPFADVALQDGDSVIVERLQVPLFTVIGLVNNPGNFPYPPGTQYNLIRTLAFAGGVNLDAEPHYATIYRLKPDGTIVSTTLRIVEDSKLTAAANTLIKPGDVIDLAHTPRTRTNLFLQKVFSIHVGAYVPVWRD